MDLQTPVVLSLKHRHSNVSCKNVTALFLVFGFVCFFFYRKVVKYLKRR